MIGTPAPSDNYRALDHSPSPASLRSAPSPR